MPRAETALPHPALGTRLEHLQELVLPGEVGAFREVAEAGQPCVLRGLAAHWPCVESGRFKPATAAELRRRMGPRSCHVSFEPSSTLFGFEVPEGWVPPPMPGEGVPEGPTGSTRPGTGGTVPRLVNPGRIAMTFASFLDVCDRKCHGGGASGSTNRVVNVPYDQDHDGDTGLLGAESNSHMAAEAPLDVPCSVLEKLALYCVEDASCWPQDLLRQLMPGEPAAELLPEWSPLLQERRLWMSTGGPKGVAHVTAGFHWDHLQNIHVLLSGRKEVFLLPPMEAPALQATRFCPQAQWRMEADGTGSAHVELMPLHCEESSSDYAMVAMDQDFAANAARSPALQELRHSPCWAVLRPGDAVHIPAGWWHSIRTWRPRREERGLPFSLSANFWYAPTARASRARQPELLTLQVLSCQRALAGGPRGHLDAFLRQLEARTGGKCGRELASALRRAGGFVPLADEDMGVTASEEPGEEGFAPID